MSLNDDERKAIVDYRLEKCDGAMFEAHMCVDHQRWTLAVQRLYYAAFYAASALLIQEGFFAKSHAGIFTILCREFVQNGRVSKEASRTYGNLLNMRHSGDYDDSYDFVEEDVLPYLDKTKQLIAEIKSHITI